MHTQILSDDEPRQTDRPNAGSFSIAKVPDGWRSLALTEGLKPDRRKQLTDSLGRVYQADIFSAVSEAPPAAIHSLARDLLPLCVEGFMHDPARTPKSKIEALYGDLLSHIKMCDRLTVCRLGDEVIGFSAGSSLHFRSHILYHVQGMVVKPAHQGVGLGKALIGSDLGDTAATALGFHTQSRISCKLAAHFATYNAQLALEVSDALQTAKPCGLIDKFRYAGECLYGDQDKFSTYAIQSIDWRKGDALIWAGYVNKP